ncbi:MAG: TonB-dependent receptor plug domain-containing protein, partial [Gammaproteobacteria bacterium]
VGVQVEEVRRPRHTGGVNLNCAVAGGRGNLNLNVHYNGEQVDLFFPPFPQSLTRVTLDEYVLVSLAAEYRILENVVLFGRVENLLDEDYEEVLGFGTPGLGAYAGVRFNLKP